MTKKQKIGVGLWLLAAVLFSIDWVLYPEWTWVATSLSQFILETSTIIILTIGLILLSENKTT
jgi:hypothetical protein